MSISILSGKWKNTFLKVSNFRNLRITSMFIKKKLFNWINLNISNIKCLDLFAGSGSLGFECASRNCKFVVLVENNKINYKNLIIIKKKLLATNVKIFNLDYKEYINLYKYKSYDLIFIDPPYKELYILINSIKLSLKIINSFGYIYVETLINLFILIDYFKKELKVIKKNSFKKINFILFQVI